MDRFLSSLMDKINDLLFEVLGLLLPSLILCIILFEPVFYINNFSIKNNLLKDVGIESLELVEPFWIFLFLIAFFYVIGNVIKVVSKIYYDFGKAIFDNTILAFIFYLFHGKFFGGKKNSHKQSGREVDIPKEPNGIEKWWEKSKDKPGFTILNVFCEWIKKTLSFSVENYGKDFEYMYINLAVDKLGLFNKEEKDKKWFLFYKKAVTILEQENVDTLYY